MNHISRIHTEFEKQASSFDDFRHTIGSHEIMDWIIQTIKPSKSQIAIDVAAGTALLGRALAKHVNRVVAIDTTRAMLDVGMKSASEEGIDNIEFVEAVAENIPFSNQTFDLVVSRLAVHHFVKPDVVISEMCRIAKPAGNVFVVDLLAPDLTDLQKTYNALERMRDPSHTQALTENQLLQIFKSLGKSPVLRDMKTVEVDFLRWVELAKTPDVVVEELRKILTAELAGGDKTGFQPHLADGQMKFFQHWAIFQA